MSVSETVGSVDAGSIEGNVSIAENTGSVNIDNVSGDLTLSNLAGGENSRVDNVEGKSDITLAGGSLEIGNAGLVNVTTLEGDKFAESGSGVKIGNLTVENASDLNVSESAGGNIQGMSNIDNLNIANNTGELNIGTTSAVSGNVTIANTTANINVGEVESIDVTLNGADITGSEAKTVQNATVNGTGNASLTNVGNLTVDSGLDGNLTAANVSGSTNINNITGSATVNTANGDISAVNVQDGLNVGNVQNINVNNTNVNVLDGGTVAGNIVSQSDVTLSNGGNATLNGGISVSGNLEVASEGFDVTHDVQGAVIKADSITGDGAKSLIHNYYDKKYGFSAKDDSILKVSTLVGTHDANVASSDGTDNKLGHIEGSLGELNLAVENQYVDVSYHNKANDGSTSNSVNYTVDRNSYLQDKYAKTENEKALASVFDNLAYQNDADADALSVAKKQAIASNPSLLSAMLPQSISHAARINMDLGDMMHMDTLYRTSATRDMLNSNKYGRAHNLLRETTIVSIRNINKFSSYGGDANNAGSDDYVYGGLVNLERILSKDLFVGVGVGGFEAESDGKGNGNKADAQSFAMNAYLDWAFYDSFDWYFGINYALGMNNAERRSFDGVNKSEWNSNLVGAFTGVRYTWKPYQDRNFFIKPTVGVNANFLLNPSITEDSGSDRLKIDSDDYNSIKAIVGVEASYVFENGFYLAGRMFYTHEFGDNSYDLNAMFINSSSLMNTFRMRGLEMDRDSGIFGVGVGYDITKAWRVYLDYAAEVTGDVYHNVNAGVQFKF